MTLTLLWQEYRAAHPDGYGYTWFCEHFAAFEPRTSATFRNQRAAGAVMQTDYAGQTVPVIDPATGAIYPADFCRGAGRLQPGLRLLPAPAKSCRTGSRARCERSPSSAVSPERSCGTT